MRSCASSTVLADNAAAGEVFFAPPTTPGDLAVTALRAATVNVAAQVVSFLCQTAGVVILARMLSPKDFGLVAMVVAFSGLVMNFGSNGFPEYLIQKTRIEREEVDAIFWTHLLIALALAAVFCAFGLLLSRFYDQPELFAIVCAMSSTIVLSALATHHLSLLQRTFRFGTIAFIQVASMLAAVIAAVVVARLGLGYWAIVTRQVMIPAITAVGAWSLCSWRPGTRQRIGLAGPGVKYALRVFANFSLGYCRRNIDTVLLGRLQGAVVLGQYDRAYYLATLPVNQVLTPLHGVAQATLSRMKEDAQSISRYYIRALSGIALFGCLVALLYSVAATDLASLILGSQWTDAGRIMTAFGPGVGCFLMAETSTWLHLSLGLPERWLKWNIAATVATVVAFAVSARFGGVWVAGAYSILNCLFLLPAIWYAGRPIHLKLRDVFKAIGLPFFAAVATGLAWIWLRHDWFEVITNDGQLLARAAIAVVFTSAFYALLIGAGVRLVGYRIDLSLITTMVLRRAGR